MLVGSPTTSSSPRHAGSDAALDTAALADAALLLLLTRISTNMTATKKFIG
jgi:hypothetical protein